MNKEVELFLKKLKIVSEEQERGLYLCDKEHSKLLLDYITNLQQELENKCWDEASIRADVLLEQQDYKSRCEKANKELINSKEYQVAVALELNAKQSILIKLHNILNSRGDE